MLLGDAGVRIEGCQWARSCGRNQLLVYPGVNQGFKPEGETLGYLGRQRYVSPLPPAFGHSSQPTAMTNANLAAAFGPGR
jgi:hypothetical protein